jgi:hypothetical protein
MGSSHDICGESIEYCTMVVHDRGFPPSCLPQWDEALFGYAVDSVSAALQTDPTLTDKALYGVIDCRF